MEQRFKEIGMRIREARKAAHLNQAQLSEALDISPSHMSDIENGKINIGLEIFMNITETLQISADWLLRSDIPTVNSLYRNEVDSLFEDCSPQEMQAFIRIIKEIKGLSHRKR